MEDSRLCSDQSSPHVEHGASQTKHDHIKPALRAFADMPHVIQVHRMTGEDCFLLKVLVPTPGRLETIVDTIARFGAVTTSLVLRSEPVKPLGKTLLG